MVRQIKDRDRWLNDLAKRAAKDADGLLNALLEYDRGSDDDDDPVRYFDTVAWLVASGANQWGSFGGGDPGDFWFVVRYGDTLTRIDWEGGAAQRPYASCRYDAAETAEDLLAELEQHRRLRPADDAAVILRAADPEAVAGALDEADRSRTWTVRVGGSAHRFRKDRYGIWGLISETGAGA